MKKLHHSAYHKQEHGLLSQIMHNTVTLAQRSFRSFTGWHIDFCAYYYITLYAGSLFKTD